MSTTDDSPSRPIPQPRRLLAHTQTSYENVTLNAINKNIILNTDNLQSTLKAKVPNNKAFRLPDQDNGNDEPPESQPPPLDHRVILTEMNNLNLDKSAKNSSNKNFQDSHKLCNVVPVAAPRRLATSSPQDIYENNELAQQEIYESNEDVPIFSTPPSSSTGTSPHPSPQRNRAELSAASGAIKKTPRRPPQLPLPSPPKYSPPDDKSWKQHNITNNNNNTNNNSQMTSSGVIVDEHVDDDCFGHKRNTKMNKSVSSTSLNSTTSCGSSASSKYTTSSPTNLLKTIGTTSRQLTEAIGERVAVRTKGATHKIDKLQQSSREKISETSRAAGTRLLNVGKSFHQSSLDRIKNVRQTIGMKLIGDNFSLDRREEKKSKKSDDPDTFDGDCERPQTVPANDELFKSISFQSSLNKKTPNCYDLSESSYEVPRTRNRSLPGGAEAPPAYRELYKTLHEEEPGHSEMAFRRNHLVTQSMHGAEEQPKGSLHTNADDKETEIPCPKYPPPILPAAATPLSDDTTYGRIRTAPAPPPTAPLPSNESNYTEMSPVRPNRNRDYEDTEIRFKVKPPRALESCSSNRATVDSAEFIIAKPDASAATDEPRLPRVFSRDVPSCDFERDSLPLDDEKQHLPSPSRSESWTYYDTTQDEADCSSSPEPIYANNVAEATTLGTALAKSAITDDDDACVQSSVQDPVTDEIYGAVYATNANASSPGGTMLTPVVVPRKRHLQKVVSSNQPAADVIKEFDPLVRNTVDQICSSKSNELILLESLLAEDTYGATSLVGESSAVSTDSPDASDDEYEDVDPTLATPSPVAPPREDAIPVKDIPVERTSVIVHQNLKLHAFDLVDEEAAVAPYLAQVDHDQAPASQQTPTRTNWFLDIDTSAGSSAEVTKKSKRSNKDPRPPPASEAAPPPYSESSSPDPSPNDDKPTASRFSSLLSNVFNKMDLGIKRKPSFNKSSGSGTAETRAKSDVKTLIEMIPRPFLTQRLIMHEGTVIRLPSKAVDDILKEQHKAMAYIRERRFQAYTDKEMKSAKENICLEHITTIQCVSKHKFTNNALELYCFEITTVTPKNGGEAMALNNPNMVVTAQRTANRKQVRASHLYGVAKESERFIWMQKLLESMTEVFQTQHTCRFYRAGWCYLKNSITSQWSGAWILLQKHKKRLVCYTMNEMNAEVLDLRKARCLILKESDESIGNLHVEKGPMLMIDCPPYSMYMVMCSPRETKIWRHIIMEVAHNNGPTLKEQQLTKDDVAVLVDKCINFVYAHGSMSEGIYRKSGSEASIQKLLQLFRADAFSVQITRSEYSEHDVANALKRFMRDLPERMLGRFAPSFVSVAEMTSRKDKLTAYKELLDRLPTIEYQTLRKLIGHLNFIQSQATRNKMHVENLAIVWGPTLLEDKQRHAEMQFSQKEADVIVDLVMLYKNLYQMTHDEVAKEQIMLNVLQKYHAAAENLSDSVKQSGDLKVWIIIDANPDDELEEKSQVNVTLTPTKTAYDICKELCARLKCEAIACTLNEHILDGDLRRPMHHTEKVFDTVLKWSYWPEADRKHNVLRLQPIKLMKDVARALKNLPIVSPNKELKFADVRTKTLKSFVLELCDARITVMKKEKANHVVPVRELDLRGLTAYLGSERKRDCAQRWAITLVENELVAAAKSALRTRECPFFGHIIAGSNTNDSLVWYSSILHSLYGDELLPNAEIIMM